MTVASRGMKYLGCGLVLTLLAVSPSEAMKAYVLSRGAEKISIIEPGLGVVVNEISLADDPDGDLQPDPPSDLTFSTIPGSSGMHAFVLQEEFIRVIDVATETVIRTHDVETLLGLGNLVLEGCESAAPRTFEDPASGLPVVKSYLHIVATLASGEAYFVIYEQQDLLNLALGAPVAQGSLGADTAGLDVKVLDTAHGDLFQRAWYQLSYSPGATDELRAVLLATGRVEGSPWLFHDTRSFTLAATPPDSLHMGAPRGRELPVFPKSTLGEAQNLDIQGFCSLGTDLRAVSVTGPGPNSYTTFAVDAASDELLVVDGTDCSTQVITTGAAPVDVAVLGTVNWMQAYTANRDGDNATRLLPDGTSTDIPLGVGSEPVAVGASEQVVCLPENLRVALVDSDGDNDKDDLELSWDPGGCLSGTDFYIYCECLDPDDQDCPCQCDCDVINPPLDCVCPGLDDFADFADGAGPEGTQVGLEPGVTLQKNPWKLLDVTSGTGAEVEDLGAEGSDVTVAVTTGESP